MKNKNKHQKYYSKFPWLPVSKFLMFIFPTVSSYTWCSIGLQLDYVSVPQQTVQRHAFHSGKSNGIISKIIMN